MIKEQIVEMLKAEEALDQNLIQVMTTALELVMESNSFTKVYINHINVTGDKSDVNLEVTLLDELNLPEDDNNVGAVALWKVTRDKELDPIVNYHIKFTHKSDRFRDFTLNTFQSLIEPDSVSFESDEFVALTIKEDQDQIVAKRSDVIMKYITKEDGTRSWELCYLKDDGGTEYDVSECNEIIATNAEDLLSLAEFGYVQVVCGDDEVKALEK